MPLILLTCTCGGSQRLAIKPLARAGVPDYMDIPLLQGDKARAEAAALDSLLQTPESAALVDYIKKPRFVIVVGYTAHSLVWVDVARNDTESMMKAEAIARAFA